MFLRIAFSIANKDVLESWGWYLASGIFDTLLGIFLVFNPPVSALVLALMVGFFIMFESINAIGFAIDLKHFGAANTGGLIFWGIVGIIFSIILVWQPAIAGLSLVTITAIAFIMLGGSAVSLSFSLKKVKDLPGKLPEELKEKIEQVKKEYFENKF